MPVIVTVHGTFATGPEAGEKWWQKESAFSRQLLSHFKSRNEKIAFEPFIWDGRNSECSRRKAGEALAKHLSHDKRPTVLIGHSHGGSVIDHALTTSVRRGLNLDHVEKIITVGTPFLSFAPPRRLFDALGTIGKSLLMACWLILIILFGSTINNVFLRPGDTDPIANFFQSVVPVIVAFIGLYVLRRYRLPTADALATLHAKARNKFATRIKVVTHADDEAVLGLKATVDRTPNVFHANFFIPKLSFYSLFIPPILLLCIAASTTLTKGFFYTSKGIFSLFGVPYAALGPMEQGDIFSNLHVIGYALGRPFWPLLQNLYHTGAAGKFLTICLAGVLTMLLFFILSRALIWMMSFFLNPIAKQMARTLNTVSSRQLHNTAWGNDTAGESCNAVSATPAWLDGTAQADEMYITLPKPITEQIRASSNAKIAGAIPKLRENLKRTATAAAQHESSDTFWDAFAGDELVHNSYFSVAPFIDLIAKEIGRTKGFARN